MWAKQSVSVGLKWPIGHLGADPIFSFDRSRHGGPERTGELPKAVHPGGSGSQDWALPWLCVLSALSKV